MLGSMIELVQLRDTEWLRLRAIRLRALLDSPDAFGSTFEEAEARSTEGWTRQLSELPTFVAVCQGADVGMVRCARDAASERTAWLISMWVAPEARRRRIGAALIDAAIGWARAHGMDRLQLDVADDNAPAIALYARKGFEPTGERGTLPPPRDQVVEHRRVLMLGP
jgi:ribosomal protein S18 acetylase RimI-like enzyme